MRQSWRFLLLRSRHLRFASLIRAPHFPSASNVSSSRHFSSFFASSQLAGFQIPPAARGFASEAAVEPQESDHAALVGDILSKFDEFKDVGRELELQNIVISHDLILKVLKGLEASPDVAWKFFSWLSESNGERLSSKSYNLMLRILGLNGFDEEFWDLIEIMKGKGYGVSKYVRVKMLEKFEKEGRNEDVNKLKGVFASGSTDQSVEKMCVRICRIVRNEVWTDEVEGKLRELNFEFSRDSVITILDGLASEPSKALIFFRWVEESGYVKHCKKTFNAMATVLGREDSIDRFWNVVDEMRSAGYDLERDTYTIVLKRFLDRKMFKESVDLYKFAMEGSVKPLVPDFILLLKKIAVAEPFDRDMFSRFVNVFCENGEGSVLNDSIFKAVVKSLASVNRIEYSPEVLNVMKENGYVPGCCMHSKIVAQICTFDLEKAAEYFKEMVKGKEVGFDADAFESLVSAYCDRDKAVDGYKLMHDCISGNDFKPWYSTYKLLVSNLLVQGGFKDALGLLDLMKTRGVPPFLDPFFEYVSKKGTVEEAVAFTETVTSKRSPSASVYIQMFEAFFKAGRRKRAREFLSVCPKYVRDHADVLNLFYRESKGAVATPPP